MNVRNCRKCGRLFNYVSGLPICPSCKAELEKKFQEVKEYIRAHKQAELVEISEKCEVEIAQLRQWVREERLEFSAESPVGVECEKCGAMIRTGRFCEKCKSTMSNQLSQAIRKPEPQTPQKKKDTKENPRMRYLDN